jgi:hypothetical protein
MAMHTIKMKDHISELFSYQQEIATINEEYIIRLELNHDITVIKYSDKDSNRSRIKLLHIANSLKNVPIKVLTNLIKNFEIAQAQKIHLNQD